MKERGLRPALASKLQEYLNRRKEFDEFRTLVHPYLKAAYNAGFTAAVQGKTGEYAKWREEFAKEEYEKHKRERSAPPT